MDEPDAEDTVAVLQYCPRCGSELTEGSEFTEAWVECPKHGEIHVEYYKS